MSRYAAQKPNDEKRGERKEETGKKKKMCMKALKSLQMLEKMLQF